MKPLVWTVLSSPVLGGARLSVGATARGVRRVELGRAPRDAEVPRAPAAAGGSGGAFSLLERAARQLTEYLEGGRRHFDLPLDLPGEEGSFSRRVWEALGSIGYGSTSSYREVAARVGSPGASRAVGQAVGRNPVPIIVPCHRVVGSDGRLTGFSAGLDWKVRLLEIEGVAIRRGSGPLSRWRLESWASAETEPVAAGAERASREGRRAW